MSSRPDAMAGSFTPDEVHLLEEALLSGSPTRCPMCDVALDRRPIPPRRDVSYVRDRIWLSCARCHRSVVIDRMPR